MATMEPIPRAGWVGWIYFGAIVMVAAGIVQVVNGLIALAESGTTYLLPSGMTAQVSYASVGVGLLVMGVVPAAGITS